MNTKNKTANYKTETWPIEKIKPYEHNPRNNSAAVDAVAASLDEFGWRQPIVVDSEGVIVCGHTRYLAAQKLGWQNAPVHVATGLSPEQCRAYRLVDNKTNEMAEWDPALLSFELGDLDLTMFGFEPKDKQIEPTEAISALAADIASVKEWSSNYDQAEKRAKKLQERIREISIKRPELLTHKGLLILSEDTNEALVIVDDALPDVLTELRRYVANGSPSPLAELLNRVHKI